VYKSWLCQLTVQEYLSPFHLRHEAVDR